MAAEGFAPQPGPLVSVRASARREIEPDAVQLTGVLRTTGESKAAALSEAAAKLNNLAADFTALGGVRRTVSTASNPLTWLARSSGTETEQGQDSETSRWGPTGRFAAHVALTVTVRDFDLLDGLGAALAQHETVNLHQVAWLVNEDNPQWPLVRADAIHAAIRQARDYATALGGSLTSIEHLSDVGLLGGTGGETYQNAGRRAAMSAAGQPAGRSDVPSLDPVPQQITAIIEARFSTTGVTLGG